MTLIGFLDRHVNGKFDTDTDKMVCVPHHKYQRVDLCMRTTGMHLPFAEIKLFVSDRYSDAKEMYADAVALGEEIVRRWNAGPTVQAFDDRLLHRAPILCRNYECAEIKTLMESGGFNISGPDYYKNAMVDALFVATGKKYVEDIMIEAKMKKLTAKLEKQIASAFETVDVKADSFKIATSKGGKPVEFFHDDSLCQPEESERSCDEPAQEQVDCKNCKFKAVCGGGVGCEKWELEAAQEQLWICPNAQNEEKCRGCRHAKPHKHEDDCDMIILCPPCIPYTQERGWDARWHCQSCGCTFDVLPAAWELEGVTRCSKCVENEVLAQERDDLRARLEKAEAKAKELTAELEKQKASAFETGELALKRGFEIERLEKENATQEKRIEELIVENAELKRKLEKIEKDYEEVLADERLTAR